MSEFIDNSGTDDRCSSSASEPNRSTGPRTPGGRTRGSQNATRHGGYSDAVVLANEDHSAFDDLLALYPAEWQPATQTEADLVTQMAINQWKFLRYTVMRPRFEAAFSNKVAEMRQSDAVLGLTHGNPLGLETLRRFSPHAAHACEKRAAPPHPPAPTEEIGANDPTHGNELPSPPSEAPMTQTGSITPNRGINLHAPPLNPPAQALAFTHALLARPVHLRSNCLPRDANTPPPAPHPRRLRPSATPPEPSASESNATPQSGKSGSRPARAGPPAAPVCSSREPPSRSGCPGASLSGHRVITPAIVHYELKRELLNWRDIP